MQALAVENKKLRDWLVSDTMCEVDETAFPVTYSAIRDIRAQGIHFAANRILAAWETGFIDDTARQAYDISGAVLSAIEFLPGASDGEFSRDYADEVRARIRKVEQE
ncbi:similar to Eae protein [Erwinia phage phiEt88]|uniref:similar to Eae protein n=1 Tax=Erwinia phage phiEt88 TaxID=925984 RepID=UPI0001F1FC76|nr:similar to Eae protein [Erwinia phage phiEt88]CBX44549.1 similar to Eae protein [Erwinia phage phiEt88]